MSKTAETKPTLNATELRANLAPALKLFKALAEVSDIADDVIAEEQLLRVLQKNRAEHEKIIAELTSERDTLMTRIADHKKTVEKVAGDLKASDDELRSKRAQMEKEANDHAKRLLLQKTDHEQLLAKAVKDQQTELDRGRSELAGVQAELRAAKTQLADFFERMTALKK